MTVLPDISTLDRGAAMRNIVLSNYVGELEENHA